MIRCLDHKMFGAAMAWRQGQSYSEDLRARVLVAVDGGMAADITIFDPDTVKPLPEFIVHDFPAGGWRFKEPAAGIYATFVNGKMLMKEGKHTGNLPGRVLRNSRYQANHQG